MLNEMVLGVVVGIGLFCLVEIFYQFACSEYPYQDPNDEPE